MKEIMVFIQEKVLGMKFLNQLIGSLLSYLGVDINSKLGGALQFFYMIP